MTDYSKISADEINRLIATSRNYSKMSDFEINKLVAISRHPELKDWICFDISGRAVFVINDGKLSRAQHGFSFTSCPSDAWPILKEYCIDINWDGDSDSEPLRDAMIVYLMMKESENEN